MKRFEQDEIDEAKEYAQAGGQALHLHTIIVDESRAPACFVRAVRRGEFIAHLFDADPARLRQTARKLGVNIIVIEHAGTPRQHIDLCAGPLRRALELCEASP